MAACVAASVRRYPSKTRRGCNKWFKLSGPANPEDILVHTGHFDNRKVIKDRSNAVQCVRRRPIKNFFVVLNSATCPFDRCTLKSSSLNSASTISTWFGLGAKADLHPDGRPAQVGGLIQAEQHAQIAGWLVEWLTQTMPTHSAISQARGVMHTIPG